MIDTFASGYGPCKKKMPILAELKTPVVDNKVVLKIDLDKNQLAANIFQIHREPTLLFFKNGKTKWRQ